MSIQGLFIYMEVFMKGNLEIASKKHKESLYVLYSQILEMSKDQKNIKIQGDL